MKRYFRTLSFALMLFPVLFHADALAQGCDQVVVPGLTMALLRYVLPAHFKLWQRADSG